MAKALRLASELRLLLILLIRMEVYRKVSIKSISKNTINKKVSDYNAI